MIVNRTSIFAAALAATLMTAPWLAPSGADASRADLTAFLERAGKMAEHNRAVRADMSIELPDGSRDTAVLIIAPEKDRSFIAFRSSGWRALMPLSWGQGKAVRSEGGKPETLDVDDPLSGTDLRAMEFFAFWDARIESAFISDSSRNEKTITLYTPDGVPYILFVVTFDKTQLVPVSMKYYRDEMSNLVRVRNDAGHKMVGSRPRPSSIEITDYSENTRSEIKLQWSTLDRIPDALLDEATFHSAEVDWQTDSPSTP